jgi:ribose transport system permease protein
MQEGVMTVPTVESRTSAESTALQGSPETGVGGAPEGVDLSASPRADVQDSRVLHFVAKFGLLAALGIIVVVFGILKPSSFLTIDNLKSTASIAAPLLILAAGLTVPLSMGEFDLSIANSSQLSAAVMISLISVHSVNWVGSLALTLIGAALVGALIGVIIVRSRVNAFIVTLGAGTVMAGIEFGVAKGSTIFSGIPGSYTAIGTRDVLGVPLAVVVALVFALLVYLVMERTVAGRRMRAVGGNSEAARLSGVRVDQLRSLGFVSTAVAGTLCALLITAQSTSYFPNAVSAQLLPAYAACFLGTTVFRSNIFDIGGTIIGVAFLAVIQDGLIMVGVPSWTAQVVEGGLLIVAVVASKTASRSLV